MDRSNPLHDFMGPRDRRAFLHGALKTGGALGVSGSAAAFLAACGDDEAGSGKTTTAQAVEIPDHGWEVVNQFFTSQNAYFQGWEKAQGEAAKALKMASSSQVDEINAEKVLAAFENAASGDVDAITTRIIDSGLSQRLLDMATDAEMYMEMAWAVAPWISPFDIGEYFYSFTTPNNIAGTEATCKALFEKMGGEGKLIQITGLPGDPVEVERSIGVANALKQFPNIEMVAKETGKWNRGETTPVIEALLTANSDVTGVFCQNDDMAIGAISALRARDMAVPVGSIDAIPDFVDLMVQDPDRAFATWTTTSGGGPWLGAWLVVQAFDALSGVELRAPERMMFAGGFVLDNPEAADVYKQLMFDESSDYPFDYALWSKALHPDDWDPQTRLAPIDYPKFFGNQQPQPKNYEIAADYTKSVESGEFEKVASEYQDHFKSDPFSEVRKLVKSGGGEDIV